MSKKTRVVVVDDHPVVRRGICATFAEEEDFEVVGEGGSAADAIGLATDRRADLILLDITMPGGGVEAAAAISEARPEAAIMMLSIREDLATVRAALRAGAHGYISKGVGGDELVASARRVLAGERYVCPRQQRSRESDENLRAVRQGAGDRESQRADRSHRPGAGRCLRPEQGAVLAPTG